MKREEENGRKVMQNHSWNICANGPGQCIKVIELSPGDFTWNVFYICSLI